MNRRVVVTGLGIVSPLGLNVEQNWQSLKEGKPCFIESEYPETSFYGKVDNQYKDLLTKKEIRYMDRVSQLAVVSAEEALKDSNLFENENEKQNLTLCIGSAIGGMETFTEEIANSTLHGMEALNLTGMPKLLSNMIGSNITIKNGIRGPVFTYNSACASSTIAIGDAVKKILHGESDVILAGGSEACIVQATIGSFAKLRTVTHCTDINRASIPFSKDRAGFVLSEGSAMLVLEEYEHAVNRGAKIYCELFGYGASSDGKSLVSPDVDGVKLCIERALKDADIKPDEVEYINAHGTSTLANDKIEAMAISQVFNENVIVSSTKCYHGHLLGATGALETALVALMIKEKTLVGQINVSESEVDPDCKNINLLLNKKCTYNGGYILNNSFGFGGDNVTLVMGAVM